MLPTKETPRVDMVALYVGDGYFAAAVILSDETEGAWDDSYWPLEMREGEYELVPLYSVPTDLAAKLERQGSSDQWFSDGYDAANAAVMYTTLINPQ